TVELTGRALAPMDARVLVVRDRLLALNAQGVAAHLDVEVFLLYSGQLRFDDEVVTVREYVQQRKRARPGCAASEPIAANHAVHRALQTEQRCERIFDSNDHNCPSKRVNSSLAPCVG